MNNATNDYQHCLDLEKEREAQWRATDQGRFEAAFCSMETLNDSFDDPSKINAFSDNGAGAWMIENYESLSEELKASARKINAARMKIIRKGGKYLLEVFYLVIKNGTNWEQSVCELIERSRKGKAKGAKSENQSKASTGTPPTASILHT